MSLSQQKDASNKNYILGQDPLSKQCRSRSDYSLEQYDPGLHCLPLSQCFCNVLCQINTVAFFMNCDRVRCVPIFRIINVVLLH